MKELKTSLGAIKFKELNALELIKLQSATVRKISSEYGSSDLLIDEYCSVILELIKDRFDFSDVKDVNGFESALNEAELVFAMLNVSNDLIVSMGEISKKKKLLEMPSTSTQKASKKKS